MSIGWTVACQHEGLWREDAGDVHAGAALGLLGADIDAWDVSALRVRAAAIVMVVAVSAGLAWVNPHRCQVLLGADPDRAMGPQSTGLPPPGGWPGTPGR
jgi:hypothetical protein